MINKPEDLETLQQRLKTVSAKVSPVKKQGAKLSQGFGMMNVGMTIVFSLVGGILVGALIGLGLDRLFGTSPLLMIVFLLFGSAAGITTAIRMANDLAAQQPMADDPDPGSPNWDDDEDD